MTVVGPARADKDPSGLAAILDHIRSNAAELLEQFPITVAGEGWGKYLQTDIRGVTVSDQRLTTSEYAQMLFNARWVLIPYGKSHEYSGSGILHDAISCGRPVITADLPVLRGIVNRYSDLRVGELYENPEAFVHLYRSLAMQTQEQWSEYSRDCALYSEKLQADFDQAIRRLLTA